MAIGGNIGSGACAVAEGAIALGPGSYANAIGAIAFGAMSTADVKGTVSFYTASPGFGYNSSNYRKITNVYDGETAHDVATVGQLPTEFTQQEALDVLNGNNN